MANNPEFGDDSLWFLASANRKVTSGVHQKQIVLALKKDLVPLLKESY
ncbi:MAG: hypothetical protein PHT78_11385 [Desulfitobacteriaceae bacterium]|nr:hypothetical protein [Desulfitobacteriaceae bacterium]MDD4753827.1 hypothetical protein [Desulfitobacteriaceae bacterium]